MRAMLLESPGVPLQSREAPPPHPGPGQIRVRVEACAVCRTDLHVFDGELPEPKLPLILGHEIVGRMDERGPGADRFEEGTRLGIPWLGWTCGRCAYCRTGRENLCREARFTGYTLDGGYAEYAVADERFCFPVPEGFTPLQAAPLLCAGLIGFRSLVKCGQAGNIGIYGFGAAAHIITQVARFQGRRIYAFTRPGDEGAQRFARELGAVWAGDSGQTPPEHLQAAIIFAPVGSLVPEALKVVEPGGIVVCGGIHMSDIPTFAYHLLWEERTICSVANLTRRDAADFLEVAARVPVRSSVQTFALEKANEALECLRSGLLKGAAVLLPEGACVQPR